MKKEIHDFIEEKESGFLCEHGEDTCVICSPKEDMVNSPSHYNASGIECIDAIAAALTPEEFVGYCKGNGIKYIWRAGLKIDKKQDLKKAVWYTLMAAGDDPRKMKIGWVKSE